MTKLYNNYMNCKGGHFSLVNIVLGGKYPPRGTIFTSEFCPGGTIFTGEYCSPGYFVGGQYIFTATPVLGMIIIIIICNSTRNHETTTSFSMASHLHEFPMGEPGPASVDKNMCKAFQIEKYIPIE